MAPTNTNSSSNGKHLPTQQHPRPSDQESSAAISELFRINRNWSNHSDEQKTEIEHLRKTVEGLEQVLAGSGNADEMPGLTLAQQVAHLKGRLSELRGVIVGLQEDNEALEIAVQRAKNETHSTCMDSERKLKDELARLKSRAGEDGDVQTKLREEILILKRKLALALDKRNQ
jgi:uncharacterized protein YihD (DUF1040 family)